MSQNTFPAFTNMMPEVEDIQLIVDSLRQEDRCRTIKDGIFTPGIVNQQGEYLLAGSKENSLKIKPFIAYTPNGDRIEVSSTWDMLYAQGSSIPVSNSNLVAEYENIPYWYTRTQNYESFSGLAQNITSQSFDSIKLGRGSVLHGIKLRINSLFSGTNETPNVWISIGVDGDLEKFLPQTLVSDSAEPTNLSVMNLMYSLDDANVTNIKVTFTSDSLDLNKLTNGSVTLNFCIANLSGFDNEDLTDTPGGYILSNTNEGTWQPSTTYHIVARYKELESNFVSLNYTTLDGTNITTNSEPTRFTTSYEFYALRKTGSVIDFTTLNDVKLGEVITDESGNVVAININGKNVDGDDYTQYLTIPGYRFVDGIDATQIGNGDVNNTQFSYLNTLTGNVQSQFGSKAGLKTDNTFEGINTFTQQIVGSIDKVNGFTANATPAANNLLVLDENGKIPAEAISENTVASIGNFYTISNGITDSNGRSNFLSSNDTVNGVVITASDEHPLVINYPEGSSEILREDKEIGGINADGYYYLVKEKDGNFIFLPTSGGTRACIPVVGSNNAFDYLGTSGGNVSKSWLKTAEDLTAYKAFDGTLADGAQMGQAVYTNVTGTESLVCTPDGSTTPTSLIVHFPTTITPTAFAACFRTGEYDITPKIWSFQGTNDDLDDSDSSVSWTTIVSSSDPSSQAVSGSTWNINEIKTVAIPTSSSYKNFRFVFNIIKTNVNNYMEGEETEGTTLPVKCYYFQIYSTNIDPSIKGNIIEGYKQPTGMSVGSYFLDISKKPYTGYKCNGSDTFEKVSYVKLGFVNATGIGTNSAAITCYPFCYNTFTISENNNIVKNSPITFYHNLGIVPNVVNVKFICLLANNGYNPGDYVENIYAAETTGMTNIKDLTDATVTYIKLWPGTSTSTLYVRNKANGVLGAISNNEWAAIIYCSRGW